MCLIAKCYNTKVRSFKDALPLITKTAKTDITVYKVLERTTYNKRFTPYRGFEWPKGKTVVEAKEFTGGMRNLTYLDLSIDNKVKVRHKRVIIDRGIHAFTSKKEAKRITSGHSHRVISVMVIPKGTPYILGDRRDDIVALKMRRK